jgi:hypothetical protein
MQLPKLEQPIVRPEQPLRTAEQNSERLPSPERPTAPAAEVVAPVASAQPVVAQRPIYAKDERLIAIEQVLEEDLADIYFTLSPQDQLAFKQAGETAAEQINVLLSGVKLQVQKIADIIKRWLGLLPGVNKFFIEQEAKIKTDKLIKRYRP